MLLNAFWYFWLRLSSAPRQDQRVPVLSFTLDLEPFRASPLIWKDKHSDPGEIPVETGCAKAYRDVLLPAAWLVKIKRHVFCSVDSWWKDYSLYTVCLPIVTKEKQGLSEGKLKSSIYKSTKRFTVWPDIFPEHQVSLPATWDRIWNFMKFKRRIAFRSKGFVCSPFPLFFFCGLALVEEKPVIYPAAVAAVIVWLWYFVLFCTVDKALRYPSIHPLFAFSDMTLVGFLRGPECCQFLICHFHAAPVLQLI